MSSIIDGDVHSLMSRLGTNAKSASKALALATSPAKNAALMGAADSLQRRKSYILGENQRDLARQSDAAAASLIDRLALTSQVIDAMSLALVEIAQLNDPIGTVMDQWERPNGLRIERVKTPLGVIGVIYESRPNVTSDAGGLCLKAGNAVILRCGSDCMFSSSAIHESLVEGLVVANLPAHCIQLVPTSDRAAVGEMLTGLNGAIDVIVPRGGASLVSRVQREARVPVFAHLQGLCHVYVDASAKLAMASDIIVNAKMRRTGICGAAEKLLIDRAGAGYLLRPLVAALIGAGCEVRASEEIINQIPFLKKASEADWSTEYLDAVITVKLVDGIDEAIRHICRYSSHHTEAVIAEDQDVVDQFFNQLDSAILVHNASTQFADGGEFGMGADSALKPAAIPIIDRPPFRFEAGHHSNQ